MKHWILAHEVLIPLEVLALLVVADVVLPPTLVVTGAFGVAAIVASALTTPSRTAAVGLVAVAMAGISALWNQNLSTVEFWLRMLIVVTASALGVLLARFRVTQHQELEQMTAIAEAAQRALLPDVPESIGSLGMAARYVSATDEASVGGDLYGVAETSHGIRVIVGDARGKGLEAVQMAATVLAAFRRAAVNETSLAAVAKDLDDVVTAVAEDEDFVTAVLAEFHEDNTVTLLSCGHHPPLLVAETCARGLLDTGPAQPPLGLHPDPWPSTAELAEGARLLFYTDGLVESRDCHGTFFPLEESSEALTTKDLGTALDGLLDQVAEHVGERVNDDLALLLVERQGGEARRIA